VQAHIHTDSPEQNTGPGQTHQMFKSKPPNTENATPNTNPTPALEEFLRFSVVDCLTTVNRRHLKENATFVPHGYPVAKTEIRLERLCVEC
jgi:hypothetical protein